MKPSITVFALVFLALLVACSSKPKPESETTTQPQAAVQTKPPAAPEYKTGREAFQRMYASARMWAGDARPYRIESSTSKEWSGADGKAAIWHASFASAGRHFIKTFAWSGLHSDDAPEYGISAGTEDTYNPSNSSTQSFDLNFLKVDSDKAYEVAQKHGGDKLVKKDPKQPVIYSIRWEPRESTLLWEVIYGNNANDAKLKVAVNASTGAFERIEK